MYQYMRKGIRYYFIFFILPDGSGALLGPRGVTGSMLVPAWLNTGKYSGFCLGFNLLRD